MTDTASATARMDVSIAWSDLIEGLERAGLGPVAEALRRNGVAPADDVTFSVAAEVDLQEAVEAAPGPMLRAELEFWDLDCFRVSLEPLGEAVDALMRGDRLTATALFRRAYDDPDRADAIEERVLAPLFFGRTFSGVTLNG